MEKNNKEVILSVKDLYVNFSTDHGYVQAVRGVSFDLYKGETLCIVGESGSGKSVTSKTIMGILAANGRIVGGSIMYEGEDLTKVSEDEFHRIRGHKIGMIFQDPLSSLNPIMRIGKQITEAILINSSHLKKMYNDLVSEELVAYKNAITELNNGIDTKKEKVKFLKSEKKKEIAKIKNNAKNEADGRIYGLEQDFGLEKVTLKHELEVAIAALDEKLKNEQISKEQYDAEVAELNNKHNEKLKDVTAKFQAKKAEIRQQAKDETEKAKLQLDSVKANYDAQIKVAIEEKKATKAELKTKYKPIIAETKAAYLAKSKEAKAKVNEIKKQYKEDYLAQVKEINENAAKYDAELNEQLETLKKDFDELVTSIVNDKELSQSKADEKLKKARLDYDKKQKSIKSKYGHKAELKKAKAKYISKLRVTRAEAKARALKVMAEVGIPNPETRFKQYPFEFSGGMRQRIVIAIALTANPDILICDEPTTALDVTIQAQILELINRLKAERNISCIFITHDLGVVANMADRVAVMYAGKIVEYGTEEEIFYDPRHPYTWALLSSIPDVDSKERLDAIPGTPPNMIYPPKGDAFALRSKYAMKVDFIKQPPFFKVSDTHYAATWLLDPRAPKVEMPAIVKARIENSLKAHKASSQKGDK